MNENELRQELTELEERIAELPMGYISKKTIAGKVRYYLQWTEEGKKKASMLMKYLPINCALKLKKGKSIKRKSKKSNPY